MKILHTSDWHLGKKLEGHTRHEEQKAFLEELNLISDDQKVDAIVISGDLFDTFNPPTESTELLYHALKRLSNNGRRLIFAIAGNHDSPDRIEAPDPLAKECGIFFMGYPNSKISQFRTESGLEVTRYDEGFVEFSIPSSKHPLRIIGTPYANELRLKSFLGEENRENELRDLLAKIWKEKADKYCDKAGVNLLVSHLFFIKKGGDVPDEPEAEKPILHVGGAQAIFSENIPSQIQYAALGHLHRKQTVDITPCPVLYSGSPLAYSFSEANQKKYVLIADISPGALPVLSEIELKSGKPLMRKKCKNINEAILWLEENQQALVELTIQTPNYLTASERKSLHNTHSGIISIIPEIDNPDLISRQKTAQIDLTKNMEELFTDYFKHKHNGQAPNENIMHLFKQLLAEEAE